MGLRASSAEKKLGDEMENMAREREETLKTINDLRATIEQTIHKLNEQQDSLREVPPPSTSA